MKAVSKIKKLDFFFSILDNKVFIKRGFVWKLLSIPSFYGVYMTHLLAENSQLVVFISINKLKKANKTFLARSL